MSGKFTLWSDDPIDSVESDRLHISPFVNTIVDHLNDATESNSSIVYSLVGPWGSGKSSILNLVAHSLGSVSGEGWSIARFTPWAASNTDGLLEEFFASISNVIPASDEDEIATKAKNRFAKLLEICSPGLKAIPVAGGAASEYAKFYAERLTERGSWEHEFSDAAKALSEFNQRILVLVDDIDRLHSSELLELMKVIRLLGRFPGVSYLLAYDENMLCRNLMVASAQHMSMGDARRYLEKIVQYPFYLPPVQQSQISSLLSDGLCEVAKQADHTLTEEDVRRIGSQQGVIYRSLGNMRSLNRVLEQLRVDLRSHKPGEVSVSDTFLLNLLHHISPEVHAKLLDFKTILIESPGRARRLAPSRENVGPNACTVDNLINHADPSVRPDVRQLLGQLFPQATGQIAMLGSSNLMQNAQYFDRYIYKKIPDGDVSDSLIRSWLEDSQGGNFSSFRDGIAAQDPAMQLVTLSKVRQFFEARQFGEAWGGWAFKMLFEAVGFVSDERSGLFTPRQALYHLAGDALNNALDRKWTREMPLFDVDKLDPKDLVGIFSSILTSGEASPAYREMQKRCVDCLFAYAKNHLIGGDGAEERSDVGYFLFLVAENQCGAEYTSQIRNLVASGSISSDTVASRFVSTRTEISTGRSELSSFSEAQFRDWIPEDLVWPEEFRDQVDPSVLSWRNKKYFARQEAVRSPGGWLTFGED